MDKEVISLACDKISDEIVKMPEYKSINSKMHEAYDKLADVIRADADTWKLFNNYDELRTQEQALTEEQHYVGGYNEGIRTIIKAIA